MAKKKISKTHALIPQETIANKILLIRGKKVMLDKRPCGTLWTGNKGIKSGCEKEY